MIAAGHTGVNASSRLHRGRGRYLNPLKNHRSPKYVSAISTIAAPAIQHMRTVSGFALPRNHSVKSRLPTSAPTVVATNSVAHSKLAKASDRAGVVGR